MRLTARGRDAWRQALVDEPDVQTIVRMCLRWPQLEVLRLLVEAMYFSTGRTINALSLGLLVRSKRDLPREAFEDATELAIAGMRIANVPLPRRGFLRGAVVEALAEGVLSMRAAVMVEVDVELSTGQQLNPQDLAVEGSPVEVYECKSQVADFNQGDADEFALMIQDAAAAGNHECVAAVATLARRYELAATLEQLTITVPIYSAALDDLMELRTDRPLVQIAP
jgi:hypothetical protein